MNRKRYLIIIILLIFLFLAIFTFANPKEEGEKVNGDNIIEEIEENDDLDDETKQEETKEEETKQEETQKEETKHQDKPKKEETQKEETKKEETKKEETSDKEKPVNTVSVSGISLNLNTLSLIAGESAKLTVTIKPSNATNKSVEWISSNNDVVSIDSNGNVVAKNAGTATITVKSIDGSFESTCTVVVSPKPDSYQVTLTPIVNEGIQIFQYDISLTKNGANYSDWTKIIYNNFPTKNGGTVSVNRYDKTITSVVITLLDGTEVTGTVVYK